MDCLFCKIVEKALPARLMFENEDLLAFEDINPKAPTHLLIIPKRHIPSINSACEADACLLGKLLLTAKDLAKQAGFAEDGYRLVFNVNAGGGQEVYHIHLHLLGGRQMTWPPG